MPSAASRPTSVDSETSAQECRSPDPEVDVVNANSGSAARADPANAIKTVNDAAMGNRQLIGGINGFPGQDTPLSAQPRRRDRNRRIPPLRHVASVPGNVR
jgi:hypothetical protein